MTEEATPSTTEGAPEPAAIEAPTDFREFVKWRETGALPPPKEETQPATAAAPEPKQVKTEPQSGADDSQQLEDEDLPEDRQRQSSRTRRIDRLTRENELLRQQLAAVQPKPAQPEPPKPAEPPGKPRLKDFQTLEAYQEALTDWKLDQREAAKKAAADEAEAKTAGEKIQAAWTSSEKAARTAHPDYEEVTQSVRAPEGPGVPAMKQAILEEPAGAEILYHLAKNPDELKRIAQLAPIAAVKEIGKLSARFAASPSDAGDPKPKVSGAPKPPPPLTRPSAGSTKRDIYDENFAKTDYRGWVKERIAQLKR